MRCSQCHSRNPIGNKFCRECGERLPAPDNVLAAEEAIRAEQERTQERVARLLSEAYSLAGQERTDEAVAVAEEAADLMPDSTSVQSLLASLYERSGQKDRAIAAVRRVVEMNPGSVVDRAVLDRLRSGVQAPQTFSGPPMAPMAGGARPYIVSRQGSGGAASVATWLPIAAAGMAAAMVLGVGLSLIAHNRASAVAQQSGAASAAARGLAPAASGEPANGNGAVSTTGTTYSIGSAPGQPKADMPPPADGNPDPFSPQSVDAARASGGASTSMAASALPLPGRNSLRDLAGRDFSLAPAPVRLIGVPTGAAADGASAAGDGASDGFGSGARLAVGPPGTDPDNSAAPSVAPADAAAGSPGTPRPDDGYIHISVRGPGGGSDTAAEDPMTISARPPQQPFAARQPDAGQPGGIGQGGGQDSGSPLARAQALEANGRYRDAIPQYQQAADSDADAAGAAYQGMALSYQRQDDTSSARAAYRRAIAAYQAQAATSRDPASAQRGIASCRAALEVLGD